MAKIWKYPVRLEHREIVMMPKGAKVLCFTEQGGLPYIYAQVDPEQPPVVRVFRVATTGEEFNDEILEYVDSSVFDGWFVAHLFEVVSPGPDPIDPRWEGDYREYREKIYDLLNQEGQEVPA